MYIITCTNAYSYSEKRFSLIVKGHVVGRNSLAIYFITYTFSCFSSVTENFREIGMLGPTFFWRCRTRRPLSLGAAEAAPKAPMARGSAPMPQAHNSCTEGPLPTLPFPLLK